MVTPVYGAMNWSGAISEAPAVITVVYSIAPYWVSRSTTCATVDCFCPMAM
jgi:hypothetical protein